MLIAINAFSEFFDDAKDAFAECESYLLEFEKDKADQQIVDLKRKLRLRRYSSTR